MGTLYTLWVMVGVGYLCGSMPFGLILGKLKGVDIRKTGSGNVGATNLGRTLGKKWGVLCLLLDMTKGLLPVVLVGGYLGLLHGGGAWSISLSWVLVGAAAVVGHVFPIWLGFKGGKGVATALGVLLGFWPVLTLPGLLALVTWAVLAWLTRYISIASIGAAVMLPVYVILLALGTRGESFMQIWPFLVVAVLLAALVVARHRGNIRRLLAGTEPQWGQKKANAPAEDAKTA